MSDMAAAIKQSKTLLRKQIKEKIGKIPVADRERQSDFVYRQHRLNKRYFSAAVNQAINTLIGLNKLYSNGKFSINGNALLSHLILPQNLINLPAYRNSQRISVYLSTSDEVSTDAIVRKSFELDKQIFVPRYRGDVMQMVKLNSLEDWQTLPLTKWLIRQPSDRDVRLDALETGGLDMVICPGVAFTKDGWRTGHGKGYYDRFLTTLVASQPTRPSIVAICFKEQLVDTLPKHDHDVQIDQIIYSEH